MYIGCAVNVLPVVEAVVGCNVGTVVGFDVVNVVGAPV